MAISMPKIGLNTQKISFGKGYDAYSYDPKGFSSGCSSSRCNEDRVSSRHSRSESGRESRITRRQLLDKLNRYSDDPVMVRIITQQLRNLD